MGAHAVHHVGYLTSDVERASAELGSQLGLEVTRRFERPQYSLFGVYLGVGPANIEVFSFTDPALVDPRLGDKLLLLDHVAYAVSDIHSVAAQMRERGVRFTGPDGRADITEPIDLGGVLHMWTDAATAGGLAIQLVQD
jgi:catechol 2,3-dioxygenase-like lactoylglutathione lyase family enzyme